MIKYHTNVTPLHHRLSRLFTHSFFKFAVIGGLTTALHFAILYALVELNHGDPVFSSAAGYLGGAIANYLLNFYITFNGTDHKRALLKFFGVTLIGISANTLLFAFFYFLLSLYLLAQALTIIATLIINYTLHRFWIYRDSYFD